MERALVDPLATWMPPALMAALMLIFGLGWFRVSARATQKREQAEDARYSELKGVISDLARSVADMRLSLAGFVTIDRNVITIGNIHEKINEQSRKIAVLLDRQDRK